MPLLIRNLAGFKQLDGCPSPLVADGLSADHRGLSCPVWWRVDGGTARGGGTCREDLAEQPLSLRGCEYTAATCGTRHFLWRHCSQVLYFFLFPVGCVSCYTDDFVLQEGLDANSVFLWWKQWRFRCENRSREYRYIIFKPSPVYHVSFRARSTLVCDGEVYVWMGREGMMTGQVLPRSRLLVPPGPCGVPVLRRSADTARSVTPLQDGNSALIAQAFSQHKCRLAATLAGRLTWDVWPYLLLWALLELHWRLPQTSRSERLTINHSAVIDGVLTNGLWASAWARPDFTGVTPGMDLTCWLFVLFCLFNCMF